MYKHAVGHKRWSDLPDQDADSRFRRVQRESAGVEPLAPRSFISRVKVEIIMRGGLRRRDYVRLADRLNKHRIFDAKGRLWTHISVKVFMDAFMAAPPQSN